MSRVESEVRRQMTQFNGPGLVAVSGGADSVALLLAMKTVCQTSVTAVHVNYKMRGDESDGDEDFVHRLTETLQIECVSKTLPIVSNSQIEENARRLRYDWFRDLAAERNCKWIALGHTADDQIETVLYRFMRGTGLKGLMGIPYQRFLSPEISIVRPFLHLRRKDILEYLDSRSQKFRSDSSNSSMRFTRNQIRHELIPVLHRLNPQFDVSILRLAEQTSEFQSFLEEQIQDFAQRVVLPPAGEMQILDANLLSETSSYLVRSFFRYFWQQQSWPQKEMTAEHWQRLGTLQSGDFPGGVSVRRVGKVVQISRKS